MATYVVTGATGGVGSWTVDRLADAGHDVVGVDVDRPKGTRENVDFYAADLTDQGQAWEVIADAEPDAVVHLAGIPTPLDDPGTVVFETNALTAYNVLVAAGRVGADVVWTSSESAYGMPFAEPVWLPDYFPIDEDHERRPEDPYGTSKVVGEEIAKMVVRRYGVSVTTIRPTWVQYPGRYVVSEIREAFDPEDAELLGNFWSYVDVRDVVSMIDAALSADLSGHEVFLCAAAENFLGRPTAETIERVAGDLPERCGLEGEESAFTTAKARERLDWEPSHSWREAEGEDVPGPAFVD